MRVLIADDDFVNRKFLAKVFADYGDCGIRRYLLLAG